MPNAFLSLNFAGGVNRLTDERSIGDNELVTAKNTVPIRQARLGKRPGFGPVAVVDPITNAPPIHFAFPAFEGTVAHLSIYRGWTNNVTTRVVTHQADGAPLHTRDFGVVTQNRPAVVGYRKATYIFPGYPATVAGTILQANPSASDGAEFVDFVFLGTGNETVRPQVAAVYLDRMVFGNLGPGFENHLLWSDRKLPTTVGNEVLAINGRTHIVGNIDGDRIVALVPVLPTDVGTPAQSALLVLKEFSAYIITGEPNQTADAGEPLVDLKVSRINYDCGCSSAETVTYTPYGVYWAGYDDVWFMATGQLPVRIGSKIRSVLLQSPAAVRYLWNAAYFNGFLRLAVMADGQGPDHDAPCGEQWWLDLRDGPPRNHQEAKWWGPQVYVTPRGTGATFTAPVAGTRIMISDTRPGRAPALLSHESLGYNASTNELDDVIVSYDVLSGRDIAISFGLTQPNIYMDNEIACTLLTKNFDWGEDRLEKLFHSADINLFTSHPAVLLLSDLVDGGRVIELSMLENFLQKGFVVDVDPLDSTTLTKEFQTGAFHPASSGRRNGKLHQFQLEESQGYIIDADSDILLMRYIAGGFEIEVTLTQNILPTFPDFCEWLRIHIQAFYDVLAPGIFTFTNNSGGSPRPALLTWTDGVANAQQFRFQTSLDGYSAATLRKSRKIGAMMGYNTAIDTGFATAVTPVFNKVSPLLEFGGLGLMMRPSSRRPT